MKSKIITYKEFGVYTATIVIYVKGKFKRLSLDNYYVTEAEAYNSALELLKKIKSGICVK